MQLTLVNLLHPLFLHANTYTQNLWWQQLLQFGTGRFLLEIHIVFYCQYAKFRNAAYEKGHLDLLQSFFKIKLKAHSQLSKKYVDKFCSPFFCATLSSRKNVSNMLCLIMKILTEKKHIISFTSFFAIIPILSGLLPKTS